MRGAGERQSLVDCATGSAVNPARFAEGCNGQARDWIGGDSRASTFPSRTREGVRNICGMARVLISEAWQGRDTVAIARGLLGCRLVVRGEKGRCALRITEVEAYDGPEDRASHASRGQTPRNAVMFGPAGRWYVYLCYGVHEMLNLVTGPEGHPAAVLIRGVEGHDGPGKLTRALGIDRRFNLRPATRATGLWIEAGDRAVAPEEILATPRIGVDYAGPEWAAKPWRFVLRA
jgi:DNA-3-methyladenine glycosylase